MPRRQGHSVLIFYAALTLFSFVFNEIYALFSHGVSSAHMTYLWIYVLTLGVGAFSVILFLCPALTKRRGYRLFFNLYNAANAALFVWMTLTGVLEIAGAGSPYTAVIRVFAYALYTAAAAAAAYSQLHSAAAKSGERRGRTPAPPGTDVRD